MPIASAGSGECRYQRVTLAVTVAVTDDDYDDVGGEDAGGNDCDHGNDDSDVAFTTLATISTKKHG